MADAEALGLGDAAGELGLGELTGELAGADGEADGLAVPPPQEARESARPAVMAKAVKRRADLVWKRRAKDIILPLFLIFDGVWLNGPY